MTPLAKCNLNDVLSVRYRHNEPHRIVRVVDIRDTYLYPLSFKTLVRRPDLPRSRMLVTCQDANGKIRSLYGGCEAESRRISKIRAILLKLRGKLPARKVVWQ